MLVLSRKLNESIRIDDLITVKVVKVQGNRVYLGIEAPSDITILRAEIPPDSRRNREAIGSEPDTAVCLTGAS